MANNFELRRDARDVYLPSANYATHDEVPTTLRPCIAYDADTDESAYIVGVIPVAFTGSGTLKVKIKGCSSATTGNTARFDVFTEFRTPGANEALNASNIDATADSVTITDSTTAYGLVEGTVTLTPATTPVAGDVFRIQITRDADNGSSLDTLAADFLVTDFVFYEEV